MASVVSPQCSTCIIADYGCEYRMEEWLLQCCSVPVCPRSRHCILLISAAIPFPGAVHFCSTAALWDTPTNISNSLYLGTGPSHHFSFCDDYDHKNDMDICEISKFWNCEQTWNIRSRRAIQWLLSEHIMAKKRLIWPHDPYLSASCIVKPGLLQTGEGFSFIQCTNN